MSLRFSAVNKDLVHVFVALGLQGKLVSCGLYCISWTSYQPDLNRTGSGKKRAGFGAAPDANIFNNLQRVKQPCSFCAWYFIQSLTKQVMFLTFSILDGYTP